MVLMQTPANAQIEEYIVKSIEGIDRIGAHVTDRSIDVVNDTSVNFTWEDTRQQRCYGTLITLNLQLEIPRVQLIPVSTDIEDVVLQKLGEIGFELMYADSLGSLFSLLGKGEGDRNLILDLTIDKESAYKMSVRILIVAKEVSSIPDSVTVVLDSSVNLITNPSFEGKSQIGNVFEPHILPGWEDCGAIQFSQNTPFDVHGVRTNFWGVTRAPSHGSTFIGLVTREDGSYESVMQKPKEKLVHSSLYYLQFDIALDNNYESRTITHRHSAQSFTAKVNVELWLGDQACEGEQLIYRSDESEFLSWQTHKLVFRPEKSYDYLIIKATHLDSPANGHILLDNFQYLQRID